MILNGDIKTFDSSEFNWNEIKPKWKIKRKL